MTTRRVTVGLDDQSYETARRRAAEEGRSLASVVLEVIEKFVAQDSKLDGIAPPYR